MKHFKQFILMAVILVSVICLSGCIVIPQGKYYDISAEQVSSVQFYDFRNSEYGYDGFDHSEEPVYTLAEDQLEDFLNDFSNLRFSDTIVIALAAVDPSFSYGDWVVRINFTDGSYTLYSCGGYGETYDADGNVASSTHFSCDEEELAELIGKYYSIESPEVPNE